MICCLDLTQGCQGLIQLTPGNLGLNLTTALKNQTPPGSDFNPGTGFCQTWWQWNWIDLTSIYAQQWLIGNGCLFTNFISVIYFHTVEPFSTFNFAIANFYSRYQLYVANFSLLLLMPTESGPSFMYILLCTVQNLHLYTRLLSNIQLCWPVTNHQVIYFSMLKLLLCRLFDDN